jgi:hypothetical protein
MWRTFVIVALMALVACSTQRAVKVRCDRHLVDINAPTPADQHSVRSSPADGEKR